MVTPVAELEPVVIDGATVSRASLHNFTYLWKNDFRVGDVVEVRRAGGVIPKVEKVILGKRKPDLPTVPETHQMPRM